MSSDTPPAGTPDEQEPPAPRPTIEDLLAQAETLNRTINLHVESLGGGSE
ncbi:MULTISPECIES: hypothetical protein [Streptomyces]|uniref:Uncharacterized protein n=1 Tax=Streptomyces celluloflavus TaxID=58344 RepID=A0ABW7RMB2_9ACTN|nr:hypothetical protein [Streptomyces kasugaensis]WSK14144.1 hypothetical protein OG717_21735 [Streptomyces celluloflavus]